MTLDNILEEIKKAESIVILAHETPDGDAIGSCLAMNVALKKLGKNPDVIIKEVPRIFDFLPNRNEVKISSEIQKYDLAISLDCADLKRLVGSEYFENAKKTIVIDHHSSNKMYGDINFVNPVAPACCQILIGMFEYFDIPIDKELGTCILTGIITDTGGFKYPGVTAETFEFTAELLGKGVNVSDIYKKVLQTKTKANYELMKKTINRMEFLEDGKVTYVKVNMGVAVLEPACIPVTAEGDDFISQPLVVDGKEYKATCVSMGNPHCVIFTDHIDEMDLEKIGPKFENHPMFPDRINTEFVEVVDEKTLRMRVWERGSGETISCGTGTCAVTVAAVLNGLCKREQEIEIQVRGGKLYDTYKENGEVYMRGPAETVFDGEMTI